MKIKKEYNFSNNRQIWRILPTNTGKLIIEERNTETKEAFFNCLDIKTGKKIFKNFQLEEKFWLGIETIYNDIIFFHKFTKPDMPGHNAVIAFDINSKKILWETEKFSFLFVDDDKVYTFVHNFEGKIFYQLDYLTGEVVYEYGNNAALVNEAREEYQKKNNFEGYLFPEAFDYSQEISSEIKTIINKEKEENIISGKIEFIDYINILLFNYHEASSGDYLKNIFKAVDKLSGKIILTEILDKETKNFKPESFFIKDNFIFLLKEKKTLVVCSIKE